MPLDPQFRTILDTFESKGLIPLVRATRPRLAPITGAWR
jgi:hypothetical protein